ncbi:cold shock domain-containing protein [Nonomuraea sp. NPDC005650]|uniref:cold-shock protein n=1 Tax=Nonomuraea sp. NPDC005650 TaxID=3157045 RepID=UPI0033ADCE37
MGTPFRPEGSRSRSVVLETLARLWDQAAHRCAAASGERLTQTRLARTSGVPLATINSWATGASLPRDLDQLTLVGNALAAAAGESPLTPMEWSRLLTADQLNGTSRAAGDGDPVIATVDRELLTKPTFSELVVDADPPRAMWKNTMLIITLEARPTRAVVLHGMRPVVLSRQPPRRACFGLTGLYSGGIVPPRMFSLDLDSDPAELRADDVDFPFQISATDVEQFRVTTRATEAEVSFHLELDWTCAGRRGMKVIDNNGKPFEIYPATSEHPELDWGCGGRHKRGCPAERLAADSSRGTVRWFDRATDSGFIIPDTGGAHLYFHRTSLEGESASHLPEAGDRVAYEVQRTRFEPHAVRVRVRNEVGRSRGIHR